MINRSKSFLPAATASWSSTELQQLKELATLGLSIEAIAAALKRTPSAIRNKAGMHGISVRRERQVLAASS